METGVKEHKDACNKGYTEKSAIAERQWDQQHEVKWGDIRILNRASRPVLLKVKEALHTPANNSSTRTGLGCWIATMKKVGLTLTALVLAALVLPPAPDDRMRTQVQEPRL